MVPQGTPGDPCVPREEWEGLSVRSPLFCTPNSASEASVTCPGFTPLRQWRSMGFRIAVSAFLPSHWNKAPFLRRMSAPWPWVPPPSVDLQPRWPCRGHCCRPWSWLRQLVLRRLSHNTWGWSVIEEVMCFAADFS